MLVGMNLILLFHLLKLLVIIPFSFSLVIFCCFLVNVLFKTCTAKLEVLLVVILNLQQCYSNSAQVAVVNVVILYRKEMKVVMMLFKRRWTFLFDYGNHTFITYPKFQIVIVLLLQYANLLVQTRLY